MRAPFVSLLLLVFAPVTVAAQSAGDDEPAEWSSSASVALYVLPDDGNYAQPTLTADRRALHLEVRYNYESLRTASFWGGYAMRGGERVEWELTPMVGLVIGATDGIAPGYIASLAWWKLDGYIEGEYVFASTSGDSFAYHWSEAAVAPIPWLRAGLATQRTRAYGEREIQRGPFVNATIGRLDASAYLFIGRDRKPTYVVSLGWSF